MNNKIFLVLVIAVLVSGGAFAQFDLSAGGGVYYNERAINVPGGKISNSVVGLFGFFDATYVEVSFGYGYNLEYDYSYRNLALLGKFPIDIIIDNIANLKIFPLAGINMMLLSNGSDLYFDVGVGVDYSISSDLFLRFVGTYGFYIDEPLPAGYNANIFTIRFGIGVKI